MSSSASKDSIKSDHMDKKYNDATEIRTEQPQDMHYPGAIPPAISASFPQRVKRKLFTRDGWLGDGRYDYGALWYAIND